MMILHQQRLERHVTASSMTMIGVVEINQATPAGCQSSLPICYIILLMCNYRVKIIGIRPDRHTGTWRSP